MLTQKKTLCTNTTERGKRGRTTHKTTKKEVHNNGKRREKDLTEMRTILQPYREQGEVSNRERERKKEKKERKRGYSMSLICIPKTRPHSYYLDYWTKEVTFLGLRRMNLCHGMQQWLHELIYTSHRQPQQLLDIQIIIYQTEQIVNILIRLPKY